MDNPGDRPRFCLTLIDKRKEDLDDEEFAAIVTSKFAYMVETIREFLIHEGNFSGLEMLTFIEESLRPHVNPDIKDALSMAVAYLFTLKREKFMHRSDGKIASVYGKCPHTALMQIVDLAQTLKDSLSSDCITFVFKNKLDFKSDLDDMPPDLSLKDTYEPIPKLFYVGNDKQDIVEQKVNGNNVEDAFNAFSMHYQGPTVEETNKKIHIKDFYDTHSDVLSNFSYEDFKTSMQQMLTSARSNEELQNELFDMLGFDSFELISELLDNRSKLQFDVETTEIPKPVKHVTQNRRDNAPAVTSQVIVQSQSDKLIAKQLRKIEKKERKLFNDDLASKEEEHDEQAEFEFLRSIQSLTNVQYPNVHDEQRDVHVKAMICGRMANIPQDAIKKSTTQYDMVSIPPKKSVAPIEQHKKLQVSDMDKIGQMVFKDVSTFNIIQSEVYPIAYHSNENMLICAPTGAGKTNIALLTIVQCIKNFIVNDVVRLDKFKIVYICPMKALAAEMAANFSKKLMPLGITVKECTGDMQLTRKEITETQMLITTPEKWDVITRKGTTDAELTSLLKLLVIDEVHLLNSDRGPVIEALVARTLRQVVNSQNMIRIVGLSATLPNYIDVAHFLRVNPNVGLYYFDSRYRSVPLTQTFIGVKATKQAQQLADTDEVCYEKVIEFLRAGHQVMVFVHSRNQTSKTANYLKETASVKGTLNLFEPDKSFRSKKAGWNASKSLENFLPFGLGIHHAGMLRKDRNEVERCFMDGAIRVLCCTATLAWGVNLPAHGVIIKGTTLYDTKKSSYVDLDVLDVLQIFGRAGRPQFDTSGHGIIITGHDKMHFYLSALTNQIPIESKLLNALTDNLNAEVVLGTISSIQEGVEWMRFTYLHRRMRMNPQVYGLQYADLQKDPDLREAMFNYIDKAAKLLDKAHMIRYDPKTGDLTSTNLGRTASYYYINFDTMEVFNETINPAMTEPDIIGMMCLASEFQQIQVRQEELEDLDQLMEDYCYWAVPGGVENVHGKVNILMQTFLSRGYIKTLSLASDMEYITQSAARIARSLFDIAVHQNKALLAGRCLTVAQMFERQLWPFSTPFRQFQHLETTLMNNIEQYNLNVDKIREMDEKLVGQAVRNVRLASKVKYCADAFPSVEVESTLQPITMGVIRVKLFITPTFKWSTTYHGKATETFWVWIEDPDNDCIYHTETISLTKAIVTKKDPIELVFTVPLVEPRPSQYLVRISSDRWMGAVTYHPLSFLNLTLPESFTPHTDLLELQPLEVSCLANHVYESLYKFSHFNPIQTQIFHCLYHTDNNILLGAPTGSGKTIAAEICIFRLFNNNPELKVVYIAPLKALVRERVDDWRKKFGEALGKKVIEITGDVTPSSQVIAASNVIITTPEKWDGMSRGWQTRQFIRQVGLMIIDEIHLLGEDRGPVLEVIVSRTNFIADRTGRKMRIVGLSTAMANARDLATWLGIEEMGLYNFRPSVRPVPLEIHITGFPGKHYCPRMISMNRPAYQAIRQHAPDSPTLIFCSSRKQTRLTAFDLITYLVTDSEPKQWLHCNDEAMESILSNVQDVDLKQFLSFGIGIHHAGLQERDRKTVEELFVNQKIQVLIATGTLAWGVNFPAHLVVIKGTEYFDGHLKRYVDMPITDVLQMMGRAGRPQFDTSGVACVFVHDIKKAFYKKFLYEPFPVESNLLQVLPDHVNAEIAAETVPTKRSLVEYLTWTYFFRRLLQNPAYYKLDDIEPVNVNKYLSELVNSVIATLEQSNCISVYEDEDNIHYESTFLGQISSYYYLSHKTIAHFQTMLEYDNSIMDLLHIMCHATEYALFPVRHNEDKINYELTKFLKLKLSLSQMESPHIKVYILLHLYLSDIELPNQEYIVDCKSVLDQALRILQAMIDITSNSGWLAVTIKAISLLQMLVQGHWISESDLLTLPHFSSTILDAYEREIRKCDKLQHADCLAGVKYAYGAKGALQQLEMALFNVFGSKPTQDIFKFLAKLPTVTVDVSINTDKLNDVYRLAKGEEYEFNLDFRRFGDEKLNVQSKKFPKSKDEGWIIIIGLRDELLSIKRVTINKRNSTTIKIMAPNNNGNFIYTVYLMSDSYIGLDQQFDIPVQVSD